MGKLLMITVSRDLRFRVVSCMWQLSALFIYLLVDILYAWIDPRIRLGERHQVWLCLQVIKIAKVQKTEAVLEDAAKDKAEQAAWKESVRRAIGRLAGTF